MKVIKKAKIPMYDCTVSIIVNDNIAKTYENLCKKFKLKFEPGEMAGAVVTNDVDHYYFLLSTNHLNHNTIGHELHHLVVNMTKDRGITEEESSAWISGYLNDLIYKTLEKNNLYPFNG